MFERLGAGDGEEVWEARQVGTDVCLLDSPSLGDGMLCG